MLALSPTSPPEERGRGAVKTPETLKGGGRERRKGEKMRFCTVIYEGVVQYRKCCQCTYDDCIIMRLCSDGDDPVIYPGEL
jgi:hypothetical protein